MPSITRLPSSDRLGAEPQCAWIDACCDAAEHWLIHRQHDVLVTTSRRNKPTAGLMMAQVPRLAAMGLAAGRYPTTILRDILLAVTTVLVDDQVVDPMLRMGLRVQGGPTRTPLAARPTATPTPLKIYQNTLGIIYGTGCAVLALPLNLAVVATSLSGATLGCLAGIAWGIIAGIIAPQDLIETMPLGLPILTHLASCVSLSDRVQTLRAAAESLGFDAAALHASLKELTQIKESYAAEQHNIARLAVDADPWQYAQEFNDAVATQPHLAKALGLTPNAPHVLASMSLPELAIETATALIEDKLATTPSAQISEAKTPEASEPNQDIMDVLDESERFDEVFGS